MGRVYKAEFRSKAVRLALGSGLSRERIARDLGIGSSTLNKWIHVAQKHDTVVADATDHTVLLRENERLRRENLLLREERELSKNATQFFVSQRSCDLPLSPSIMGHFHAKGCVVCLASATGISGPSYDARSVTAEGRITF